MPVVGKASCPSTISDRTMIMSLYTVLNIGQDLQI